jgi:hypothetical protein
MDQIHNQEKVISWKSLIAIAAALQTTAKELRDRELPQYRYRLPYIVATSRQACLERNAICRLPKLQPHH